MNDQGETAYLPHAPRPAEEAVDADAAELVRVLDEYLAALEKGCAPDRAQLIAAHPQLAPRLEKCLAGIEFIHRGARASAGAPTRLGDFELVGEIGRGGMGVVYEARQVSLRRKVAVKVLRFGGVADQEAIERFRREAETVAQLHHTNIVPIFAVGNEAGVAYYAMQFIEGRSLAAILEESQRTRAVLDPAEIARWCMQAAEALVHAHARGVVHRDIKPANLLLDPDGRIWLTDFGLAKRIDDVTLSAVGTLVGTPRYMSPEQASAQKMPVDARTDIYSLGVTLYELATGAPAFDADSAPKLISQILNVEPPAPRRVRPELPRDLETIIVKCMAKEAPRRYQSAQALVDDLRAFVEGRPIKARRANALERSLRWVRARRRGVLVASSAAAVAVATMAVLALLLRSYREAHSGVLALTTQGGALVAELVGRNGDVLLPAFPVPTPEPLTVPEGSYGLRLSAPGAPSETWPLEIRHDVPARHAVTLRSRWLWPPIGLGRTPASYDETVTARIDGRTDVFVVSMGATARVRRLEGSTGRPAWPEDFVFDAATLPAGLDPNEWTGPRGFIAFAGVLGMPALVEPAVDLDLDGAGDLVWASRSNPSLLALSGRTGKLLWYMRARARLADGTDTGALRRTGAWPGSVLGRPLVLTEERVPLVIACFVSMGEGYASADGRTLNTGPQEWLDAVSARDGTPRWRYPMDRRWLENWYSLTSTSQGRDYHRSCVLAAAEFQGRPAVIVVAGSALLVLDRDTGKDLRAPFDVGFRPVFPAYLADFDRDGAEDVLYVHRQAPSTSTGCEETLGASVVSPAAGRALWTASFKPVHGGDTEAIAWGPPPGRAFHACTDIDADGAPEVLLAIGEHGMRWRITASPESSSAYTGHFPVGGDSWAGLELLDGATGKPRWQRKLIFGTPFDMPRIDRFVPGPDIDGDGCREIFTVWTAWSSARGKHFLVVQALSGRDGSTLWRVREPVPALEFSSDYRRQSPLCFWQADADGMPLLVVPVDFGSAAPPATYVLSSATGAAAQVIGGVYDPRAADLDGDGLLDLSYTLADQGTNRLCAIRGGCPEPWVRLGAWKPLRDFDADGYVDFAGGEGDPPALVVRSGRDGRVLWQTSRVHGEELGGPPLPHGDLDKDGTPDVFVLGPEAQRGPNERNLLALSGADGRPLWTAAGLDITTGYSSGNTAWGGYRYPCIDACDLDGDGRAEALVAGPCGSGKQGLYLRAFSGRDGKLLWALPFADATLGFDGIVNTLKPKDLNGDGVLDAVLWTPGAEGPELRAFSGRDGEHLWSAAPESVKWNEMQGPLQALGDLDGDGAAEVVVAQWRAVHAGEFRCDVIALEGATGRPRWTASFAAETKRMLPPLVADLEGNGTRYVCMGLSEKLPERERGGFEVVVLDAAGRVSARVPIVAAEGEIPGESRGLWNAHDLDGDGKEELLCGGARTLRAFRGGSAQDAWSWPLPAGSGEIVAVAPARKERAAVLSVRSGDAVYGIDGATGVPCWRVEVPRGQALAVLPAQEPAGLARVCFGNDGFTVCRQAWPTSPDGRYREPPPAPRRYEPLPVDAPNGRPLPWLTALNAEEVLRAQMPALLVLAIPALLLYAARRRGLRARACIACAYFAALLAVTLLVHMSVMWRSPLEAFLGHALEPAIEGVVMGLPVVFWLYLIVAGVARRRWVHAGVTAGAALAAAWVAAMLCLVTDVQPGEAPWVYSWDGWYAILPVGMYCVGALGMVWYAGSAGVRFLRRRRKAASVSAA